MQLKNKITHSTQIYTLSQLKPHADKKRFSSEHNATQVNCGDFSTTQTMPNQTREWIVTPFDDIPQRKEMAALQPG
eukprot:m.38063 g.38063  ORF g.38063 m.38063 type:complete len:76 (-) comp10154_c0_seq1:4650-4877(-)